MSNQRKIVSEFKLLGFTEDSPLTKSEFNMSLDKLLEKNASIYGFDRYIS
jgi:hypothetical protein